MDGATAEAYARESVAECWPLGHEATEALIAELDAGRVRMAELQAELIKVQGHRAELSERCYRKDLELDELRVRDRVWRDGALAD